MTAEPDAVAAYLEEIRERHTLITGPEAGNFRRLDELHAADIQLSHVDAGVLLAAVGAVLEMHRISSDPLDASEPPCIACSSAVSWTILVPPDGCAIRAAITRALLRDPAAATGTQPGT